MTVGGCLGHSNHEIEFTIFGVRRKMVSRVATLDFKLLRQLVSSMLWESALEGLGGE